MRFVRFSRQARDAGGRPTTSTNARRPGGWPTGAVVLGTAALILGGAPAAQAQPVTPVACGQAALATAIADAASGATLSLTPFCVYTLTDSLPVIGTSITIRGNHAIIARSGVVGTPAFSILTVDDDAALSVTQVTLSNGDGEGGGAIFDNGGGPLTVTGSTFGDNRAFTGGAIFYEGGSRLSVNGCRFINNTADEVGGAIFTEEGLTTVAGSEFSDNSARGEGGAIFNEVGLLIVTQTTFTGNEAVSNSIPADIRAIKISPDVKAIKIPAVVRAARLPAVVQAVRADIPSSGDGGAIFSVGSLAVATSTFTDNTATFAIRVLSAAGIKPDQIGPGGDGGAIFSVGAMTSTDSTYTRSSASGGEVFEGAASTAGITRVRGSGGAIFNDGQLIFTGGRISMSSASGAGGGLFNDGTARLSHSHVLLNSAGQGGGGIFSGVGSVTLIATTVALNDPDNCEPLHAIAGCLF